MFKVSGPERRSKGRSGHVPTGLSSGRFIYGKARGVRCALPGNRADVGGGPDQLSPRSSTLISHDPGPNADSERAARRREANRLSTASGAAVFGYLGSAT